MLLLCSDSACNLKRNIINGIAVLYVFLTLRVHIVVSCFLVYKSFKLSLFLYYRKKDLCDEI